MTYNDAVESAEEFIDNYTDEIVEIIIDEESCDRAKDFRNNIDGSDSFFHENFIDKEYDLQESSEILKIFSDFEEIDSGLWEGQEPERAISTKATFTYGNAVHHEIIEKLDRIENEITGVIEAYDELESLLESIVNSDVAVVELFHTYLTNVAIKAELAGTKRNNEDGKFTTEPSEDIDYGYCVDNYDEFIKEMKEAKIREIVSNEGS